MNLLASIAVGALFFLAFYIFPSKHQNDWYYFKIADGTGGAILSVIGFVGLVKVRE